ncbi:MAG: GyrI-like domain-containing protein [Actinomycetota bacterium]
MAGTAMKVDLKRQLGELYRAHAEPALVEVPSMRFLMIDGHGDPNGSTTFREAVQSLYAVSYGLKFRVRGMDHGIEYGVMPLEGLWWIPNARVWDFEDKSDWDWTLMIMQPDVVTEELVDEILAEKADVHDTVAIERLRFETFAEGTVAQALHVGPWAAERATLERLSEFVRTAGYLPTGKHHEIYLSDPARTAPERLRTIVRHPVYRREA